MIELTHGVGPAAPVVHLGRLAGVDAGKFEQRQSTNRVLGELDAFPEQTWAWPSGVVLNHEGHAMVRGMSRRVPQHGAAERQHQRNGRANY
jgi:hypothetical protein